MPRGYEVTGEPDYVLNGEAMTFYVKPSGRVTSIDNIMVSRIARIAGAPHDKGAGMYIHKHVGDKVKKGEKLFTIYAEGRHEFEYAVDIAKSCKAFTVK